MAATTNRARAGDALRPSKLFDGARPGAARPRGKAELADSHHLRSQSQSSPQLRAGRARSGQIKRKRRIPNQHCVRPSNIIPHHISPMSVVSATYRKSLQSICPFDACKTVLDLNFTQHYNCALRCQTRIMRKSPRRSVSNSEASPSSTGRRP